MSTFDDNQDMRAQSDELLLTGHAVPDEPGLVDLVATLRRTADAPAPRPTPALAMLLRDGLAATATAPVPVHAAATDGARRPLRRVWRYVAGLGLAGKIALGAGIAFAGVTGVATIGAVPDAIQAPARAVVHGVEHLFAPGSHAPVVPVPASSPTHSRGTTAPAPQETDHTSTFPGQGPTLEPLIPTPTPATGREPSPVPVKTTGQVPAGPGAAPSFTGEDRGSSGSASVPSASASRAPAAGVLRVPPNG